MLRTRLAFTVALALVPLAAAPALGAPALAAPAPAAAVSIPWSPGGTPVPGAGTAMRLFAPEYMDRTKSISADQAVAIASSFDLLYAPPATFAPFVSAMRATNPRLTFVVYLNGTLSDSSGYPDDWYLKDGKGRRVSTRLWHLWLMNPHSAGWIANRADACRAALASSGYDTCGFDNMAAATLSLNYVTPGLPVDPATHAVFTPRSLVDANLELADRIGSQVGVRMWANGVVNGQNWFSTTNPLSRMLDVLGGAQSECFIRCGRDPLTAWPRTYTVWKQNVDMLVAAEALGKPIMALTKSWSNGSQALKDQWHRFSLGSFLLGASGTCAYNFTYRDGDELAVVNPWWARAAILARPTAPYQIDAGGVGWRTFEHGVVAVNPTASAQTIDLPSPLHRLDGSVVTSLTLQGHDAEILTES